MPGFVMQSSFVSSSVTFFNTYKLHNLNKSEITPFFSHESFAILMSDWMPHVTDNLSLLAAYLPLMLWNFPESIKTDQKLLTARVKEAQAPLLPATHPPPSSRP